MKKVKPLVFEEWYREGNWIARTVFNDYTICQREHSGYKGGIVYQVTGVNGTYYKRRKSFKEAVKLAQVDWESRLAKIDECYE